MKKKKKGAIVDADGFVLVTTKSIPGESYGARGQIEIFDVRRTVI